MVESNNKTQVTRTVLFNTQYDMGRTSDTNKTDYQLWKEYSDFLKRHPNIELLSIDILKSGSIMVTYLKYEVIDE